MQQHRPPTRHDIGKTVEVRNHDNEDWKSIKLVSIDYDETSEPMYWERDGKIPGDRLHFYYHCRVPYTTADPLTELSIAADLLAENGMDEGARVLMREIEQLNQNTRMQASIDRLIADGLGVLPDESRPNWEEHEHRYFVYRNANREPVVALRFETAEINAGRYEHDRKNYTIGMWNSYVCPVWQSSHLTWPDGTPLSEMQEQIERADSRVARDLANRRAPNPPEPQP